MKLTFLGGANEIGASATLIEVEGLHILIDCGIRMNSSDHPLPQLELLRDIKKLDAIILTHAHMDHSGGLPFLHQTYPNTPVYMTAPTLSILTVLLLDSLKIMKYEFEKEGEIPLYPQEAVEHLISSSRPLPFDEPLSLFEEKLRLTLFPAGHILGASSIYIESKENTVFFTGDFSVTSQITVPGIKIPPNIKPDTVVIESTYGERRHAERKVEEKRIIEQTKEITKQGGSILFPTFAVGRSQEVILILARAIENGELPKIPIFIDGMVKQICTVYRSHAKSLSPWMQKRIKVHGNPFYSEEGTVTPIWKQGEREKAANTRPAIYIASSGMLTGGASPYYAQKLATNEKNFIAITGYQDEESPGRHIQKLAHSNERTLSLYGEEVEFLCRVGTYGLSAHADMTEIASFLEELEAHEIILVHGDDNARDSLQKKLIKKKIENVHTPNNGYSIALLPSQKKYERIKNIEAQEKKPKNLDEFTLDTLPITAEKLLEQDGRGRVYTIPEILLSWGLHQELTSTEVEGISQLLHHKQGPFKADKKRPFLFRLRTDITGEKIWTSKIEKETKEKRNIEENKLVEIVDSLFGKEERIYKRKFRKSQLIVTLFLDFPLVPHDTLSEKIEELYEKIGWRVKIHPETNQELLEKKAREVTPKEWPSYKKTSIYREEKKVIYHLGKGKYETHIMEETAGKFLTETGFCLEFKQDYPKITTHPPKISPSPTRSVKTQNQDKLYQMEFNNARLTIQETFSSFPHQLTKCSLKNDHFGKYIEVSFISPQIGNLYQELLQSLESQVGWPIQIKKKANQHQIKELTKQLIPFSWKVRKEPSFLEEKLCILVRLHNQPPQNEIDAISKSLEENTGYRLITKLIL